MTTADAPAVHELMVEAFQDLDARFGRPIAPPPVDVGAAHARIKHVVAQDPGGSLVAERDGRLAGAALATLREGVWGLSLLVVRPGDQSAGAGRALLAAALDYGADEARGWIILSSDDPRAIRSYARAGLALHPSMVAKGAPARRAQRPSTVRRGGPDDLPLTAAVDRVVRGGAKPQDIAAHLAVGRALYVVEGRGYAVAHEGKVSNLGALDEQAAADLVRAVAADLPGGEPLTLEYLTAAQGWAVAVALELGLSLQPWGPVFLRGDVGTFSPYVPNGAYL